MNVAVSVDMSTAPGAFAPHITTKEEVMTTRFAIVRNSENAARLYRYLPRNFFIAGGIDGDYVIGGFDDAGWTLDDYVIPRLGSGLIQCVEITPRDAAYILGAPDEQPARLVEVYEDVLAKRHAHA